MTEDTTAAAALAIERYVAGLREELSVLGAVESRDLAWEIRDMLTDAARDDAEHAFAEMERLGAPGQLAATLLAERGVGGAIPTAAWWRLGIAAALDILVGIAAPLLIVVGSWGLIPQAAADLWPQGVVVLIAIVGAFGLSAFLSWQYWTPWRTGGRAITPGMALARIAVIKVGDTRTVASVAEMERAHLALPTVKMTSPGVIASILLSVLFLGWAMAGINAGALDPSGSGVIARYVGGPDQQKDAITYSVQRLYEAAASPDGADWPPLAPEDFTTYPTVSPTTTLAARFAGTDTEITAWGYGVETMSNPDPGVWDVVVVEAPAKAAKRRVSLRFVLRVQWVPGTGARPNPDWVLADYVVK